MKNSFLFLVLVTFIKLSFAQNSLFNYGTRSEFDEIQDTFSFHSDLTCDFMLAREIQVLNIIKGNGADSNIVEPLDGEDFKILDERSFSFTPEQIENMSLAKPSGNYRLRNADGVLARFRLIPSSGLVEIFDAVLPADQVPKVYRTKNSLFHYLSVPPEFNNAATILFACSSKKYLGDRGDPSTVMLAKFSGNKLKSITVIGISSVYE